jgi:hypothetical protein
MGTSVFVGVLVVLGACRSSGDDSVATDPSGSRGADATADDSSTVTTLTIDDGTDSNVSTSSDGVEPTAPPDTTSDTPPETTSDPEATGDPDELVLTDGFADEGDGWGEDTWEVDAPGEASATALNGTGVMETDLRGTDEWVRAAAPGSSHVDASLLARITPIHSDEGTVFVGLHGDGEWRDRTPYLPQTGVVVEYSYADIFEGEIVLIVLDGTDEHRIGPALGPVLADGQSANIRFEVVGGLARVKVWRDGAAEPQLWDLEAQTASTDGGTVQIAYRDGVGQSVAWDELTLLLFP